MMICFESTKRASDLDHRTLDKYNDPTPGTQYMQKKNRHVCHESLFELRRDRAT
jgi:hypothetical protein